ncbi:MAG: AEC family transporter [Blautia sp.]|nr:AEC family transporter [Blautia sp.]
MSEIVVFQQMCMIAILIMTGYISYRKGLINLEVSRGISALVVNVCNPMLLIKSGLERDTGITADKLLLAAAGGVILYLILLASALVLPRLLRVEVKWRKHYALMCLFGNTGFIGIPLTSAVLGSGSVIYVAVINLFYNLLFYTLGIKLADPEDGQFSFRSFVNVGNIGAIAAILLFVFQLKVPMVISSTVTHLANATTFLAMVVVGVSLARADVKAMLKNLRMYLFIAIRFVVVPIIISFVLRLFIKDDLIFGVMVLMACVPVGNLPLMRVEEKGGDGRVLSNGIILSTILSIITIPIVVAFV